MAYRDELDAAQARAQALERELADARDKIEALERGESQALVKVGSDELMVRADVSGPAARRWLGAPHRLELTRTLDGELPEAGYVELIELIRLRLNDVGATTVLPGSLAWTATLGPNQTGTHISVYVTVRKGKTSFRIQQKLAHLAGGIYGGVGGGVGMSVGLGIPIGVGAVAPFLLPLAIPLWLGGTYWACRRLYRRMVRKRAGTLETLLDDLVDVAEQRIAETETT